MPRFPPKRIERPILVMVEGNDDQALFMGLIKELDLSGRMQIWNAGSKSEIEIALSEGIQKTTGFEIVKKIAIFVDADIDATKSIRLIESFIAKAKLPVSIPCVVFTIPEDRPGMLEDLCLQSVSKDPAMPCVEAFTECISKSVSEAPHNNSKARFLSFMASRPKATNGTIEQALQKEYIQTSDKAFDQIRKRLRESKTSTKGGGLKYVNRSKRYYWEPPYGWRPIRPSGLVDLGAYRHSPDF